jgi:3-isopropylmalate dehydrogenase
VTCLNTRSIAIVGGDGIGPEVTAQGRRILAMVAEKRSLPIKLMDVDCGADAYKKHGKLLPKSMSEADAILFGATGGPAFDAIPAQVRKADSLLAVRRDFDLFANLRPVKTMPAL